MKYVHKYRSTSVPTGAVDDMEEIFQAVKVNDPEARKADLWCEAAKLLKKQKGVK